MAQTAMTLRVNMDTRQLEDTLRDFAERLERFQTPRESSATGAVGAVAAACVVAGSARPVSRRTLLGLGWLKGGLAVKMPGGNGHRPPLALSEDRTAAS